MMRRLGVVSFLVVALAALSACGGNSPGGSGGTAPTITTQPTDQTVTAPATATFTVVATGTAPLSYQWQKNNANIPGAPDSASYTTPATMLGDPVATFRVIVSNGVNPSATSNSAALTVSSGPATPALVQHVSSSNTRNNNFTSPFCYHTQLPGLTTAGNAVVVGFTYNSNVTPTVTDDQGDSYTIEPPFYDSTHTQSIAIAAAFNVKAGARAISVCFASNPGGFVEPMATEFDNVIGFDVAAAGNKGTGTTLMAGSMTPTVTGDLAYQVAHSLATNQDQASFTAGSQSNITWKLVTADLMDGWTGQYGIYNSVGAIDPTMSMGTSKNWISTAVLLKTGTTGGVPSGMRIVSLLHENIPTKTAAGGNATSFPNPTKLQFPCSGNLGVVTVGGGNQNLTGITDSNGNTWTQVGTYVTTSDPSTNVFYAANARCSPTQTLTVNWNGNTTDQTILYYDVAGAAASPLDVAGGATGDQGFASNTLTTFSIAPTTSSTELIFCAVPVQFDTVTGLTTGFNDANMFDGESLSGPEPVDENNGWGHFVTNSTSTVSVVWNLQSFSPAVQIWAAVGAAFKAGP
ncbi:MAG TPA: immunoglobulin domain-containing protein [Candidatus Acidoferrales bacterium]|nr:immunoglobulin domain-containing protein [Candidatus Acidoferrales bacterium]